MKRVVVGALLGVVVAIVALASFYAGVEYQRTADLHLNVGTGYCVHIIVEVQRSNGEYELIKDGVAINNDGVLTDIGKDFVMNKLSNTGFADNNKFVVYISLSNASGTPSAAWTQLPGELTTGGLARAEGTFTQTGTGQWEITVTFTASESVSNVRLTGLHWDASGDGNLFAADQFTPVNLEPGDKLTITWVVIVT